MPEVSAITKGVSVVIFDASDTLFLKSKTLEKINPTEIGYTLYQRNGFSVEHEKYVSARQRAIERYRTEFDSRPERFRKGFLYQLIGNELGVEVSEGVARKMEDEYQEIYLENEVVEENAVKVFEWLHQHGKKIVVLSNGRKDLVEKRLEKSGLLRFVDLLIVSLEEGEDKSSLTSFRKIIEHYHVEPSSILMVGDRLDEDMYAKKVGIKAALVKYVPPKKPVKEPETPDYELYSLNDIIPIIEGIK